jgi:hypothetical protein
VSLFSVPTIVAGSPMHVASTAACELAAPVKIATASAKSAALAVLPANIGRSFLPRPPSG